MSSTNLTSVASMLPLNVTAFPIPTPHHAKLPIVIITPFILALFLVFAVVIVHSIKQGKLRFHLKCPVPLPVLPTTSVPASQNSAANTSVPAPSTVTMSQRFLLRYGNVLREWKNSILWGKNEENEEVKAVVYECGVKKRSWKEFQERYGQNRG